MPLSHLQRINDILPFQITNLLYRHELIQCMNARQWQGTLFLYRAFITSESPISNILQKLEMLKERKKCRACMSSQNVENLCKIRLYNSENITMDLRNVKALIYTTGTLYSLIHCLLRLNYLMLCFSYLTKMSGIHVQRTMYFISFLCPPQHLTQHHIWQVLNTCLQLDDKIINPTLSSQTKTLTPTIHTIKPPSVQQFKGHSCGEYLLFLLDLLHQVASPAKSSKYTCNVKIEFWTTEKVGRKVGK